MSDPLPESSLFVVSSAEGAPLLEAVERSLAGHAQALTVLPALTNVAVGDPYLARQLAELHARHELRPPASTTLLARLRTRLAWWLLGPELRQASEVNALLLRALDSLVVQLDQDRAARRRLEEQLAYRQERP